MAQKRQYGPTDQQTRYGGKLESAQPKEVLRRGFPATSPPYRVLPPGKPCRERLSDRQMRPAALGREIQPQETARTAQHTTRSTGSLRVPESAELLERRSGW